MKHTKTVTHRTAEETSDGDVNSDGVVLPKTGHPKESLIDDSETFILYGHPMLWGRSLVAEHIGRSGEYRQYPLVLLSVLRFQEDFSEPALSVHGQL
jgi:hypothetical protein